jgi:signal transduction histidine kinase
MDVISTTAGEIMNGNLAQRIPLSGKQDEFDTLADRLNAMLERIQQLIKGIREVTDNVAHDLRSPLTRLRNHMEITLLEPRSPDEYQQVLRQSIEEIESLITTFNALLSIAQAEAGNNRVQWTQVDLKQLAMDLMDLYTPLTEAKAQTLGVINGDDAIILGNRDLLTQSLGNLLENAIKFTPNGGNIRLQIKVSKNQVEVIVADSGPGIPEAEKSRVLEKFVRLDSSRHTPGNGLGLSLVAAVASLHKAELILKDGDPGLQVIQRFNKTT